MQTRPPRASIHRHFDKAVTGVQMPAISSGDPQYRLIAADPVVTGSGAVYSVSIAIHGSGAIRLDLIEDDRSAAAAVSRLGGADASGRTAIRGQSYHGLQAFPTARFHQPSRTLRTRDLNQRFQFHRRFS